MIALYVACASVVVGVAALVGMQARWDRKVRGAAARAMQSEPSPLPVPPPPPVWLARFPAQMEDGRWYAAADCSFGGAVDVIGTGGYTTRRAAIVGAKRLAARLNRGEAA